MEVDTRHGIHIITEKAGSYHTSSENWQINLKVCQTDTPFPIVRRASPHQEPASDERGDRTSIIVMDRPNPTVTSMCSKKQTKKKN